MVTFPWMTPIWNASSILAPARYAGLAGPVRLLVNRLTIRWWGHRVDDPALHAASAGLEGGLPLSLRGRPGDLLQEADRVRFPDGEWDDHRSDPVAGGVGLALGAHGNRDHGAEAKSRRQLGTAGEQGPCASRDSGEHDVVHRCAMRMGHLLGALQVPTDEQETAVLAYRAVQR